MTKEEYLEVRDKEEVPLSLFYEYWNEVKPKHYQSLTLEEFSNTFPLYMREEGLPVNTPNGVKRVSYKGSLEKVFNHFNKKFNLCVSY